MANYLLTQSCWHQGAAAPHAEETTSLVQQAHCFTQQGPRGWRLGLASDFRGRALPLETSLRQPSRELGAAGPGAGKGQAGAAAEQRAGQAGQAQWGQVQPGCHGPGEGLRERHRAAPAPAAAATAVTGPWRAAPAARAPGLQLPGQTGSVQAWAATQRELLAHAAPSARTRRNRSAAREERTQTVPCAGLGALRNNQRD